ncbi:hypothetical protein MTO96_024542 [Rhipicephalus appendiculatus]
MRRPGRTTVISIIVTALVAHYSLWVYYNECLDESAKVSQPTLKEGLPQKDGQKHEDPATTTTTTITTTTTNTLALDNAWTPFYHRRMNDGKPDLPRILFWTKIYGSWFSHLTEEGVAQLKYKRCPDRCYIANHRRKLNVSDAVVFYGHDLDPKGMPEERASFQKLDSDILDNYITMTKLMPAKQPYSKQSLESIWKRKFRMAAWAVSSCETSGKREHYVRELRKYIDVDVDYVTEKLFKPLMHDIIPVVYGGANYSDAAPPGSYIDALSFESPMHLARHLKRVARDFNLYKRYFEWKGKYKIKPFTYYNFCALCRKLHSADFKKTSVIPDMQHWWITTSYCRYWNKDTHQFEY